MRRFVARVEEMVVSFGDEKIVFSDIAVFFYSEPSKEDLNNRLKDVVLSLYQDKEP